MSSVMEFLRRMRLRCFGVSRGELDSELQDHLEREIEANVAAGMSPDEARRQAALTFGSLQRFREECHEQRPVAWLEIFFRDVRHALRGFRRAPLFAVITIATLAVGLGATTAVFSVVDRILFRSLPYRDGARLVSFGLVAPIQPQEFMLGSSYYLWRDQQTPFASMTAWTGVTDCDLSQENPQRLSCARADSDFLPTLGVTPVVGRNFTADEDRPNAPKVALLSYALWRERFGRNPGVLGSTISVDGQPTRIVGVLPRDFELPTLERADLLLPQALDEAAQRKAMPGRPMWAFARLKPGVSVQQAQAELAPLVAQALNTAPPPMRKEIHLRVRSLRDRQMHDARLAAWVLLGAVLALLLIACANVSGLQLARAAAQQRERALRSALGASRVRLAVQAMAESLVLAVAGGIGGCLLAALLVRAFVAIAPAEGIPFLQHAGVDLRVMEFGILLALICGALFGIAPALLRPRAEALSARGIGSGPHHRLRQVLVAAQIAVSLVLLAGASLLLRSLWKLESQPLGLQAKHVVTASLVLSENRYPTAEQHMAFFQQLEQRLRKLPGVNAVALSDTLPPGGWHHDQVHNAIAVRGRERPAEGSGGPVAWRWVTPDYFSALAIPVVRGRGFSDADRSAGEPLIIVSQSLAAQLFPAADPVGQHLQPGLEGPWYTVVGVAADVKNGGLAGDDEPEYYRLRRNRPDDWSDWARGYAVIVETTNTPDAMAVWIRDEVAALDPTTPVTVATMQERVRELAGRPRFEAALLLLFAAIGVLLAATGLYGVIAYLVAQRTQEIGIRIALGAGNADIVRLIAGHGLGMVAAGGVIGLAAALAASRVLSSLLFRIGPDDPLTFAAVALLLAVVAALAMWIPARAATRVEPMEALRYE